MVEVKFGLRTVDLPYTIRLYGVTDEMFDEMVDEDTKAELIYGKMIVYSPATLRHDNVAGFLRTLMRGYATDKGLGLVLGPDGLARIKKGIRVSPDLFFLTKDRTPKPLPEEYKGVPDLMLELLSLSKSEIDWKEKRPLYREAGVKEIWFVDPLQQQIIIDRLRGRYYVTVTKSSGRVESTVIKGFWIEAEWLWIDPLPNEMQCLRTILD
ncbi:MAG TPA: Uma2 family endonuclease [Gemmataceae bacterium]|nr:Uma2 family endonuclease [Gemmataceae bacterium]